MNRYTQHTIKFFPKHYKDHNFGVPCKAKYLFMAKLLAQHLSSTVAAASHCIGTSTT